MLVTQSFCIQAEESRLKSSRFSTGCVTLTAWAAELTCIHYMFGWIRGESHNYLLRMLCSFTPSFT